MNEYFQEYNANREKVTSLLEEVYNFFNSQEDDRLKADSLIKLKENVENGKFEIVVVGEFSSGKSTLLNALMHKKMLPSFTEETTAAVTFLRHSTENPNPNSAGVVLYNNGTQAIIPNLELKTIEQFVSTRGDKGDNDEDKIAKTVESVHLFFDSELLKNGVMLVDSPGLNGVAENHREITERQIEKSHACIFVFNGDHPGTKTDFEFLKHLKCKSNNIFFVINKIDAIKKSEGETKEGVVNKLRKIYREKFPEETTIPVIYPISASAALASRDESADFHAGEYADTPQKKAEFLNISALPIFEERLLRYLTQGERTRDQMLEPLVKVEKMLSEKQDLLISQEEVLKSQKDSSELIARRNQLEELIKEKTKETKANEASLAQSVNQIIKEMKEKACADLIKLQERISGEIEVVDDIKELQDYSKRIENILTNRLSGIAYNIDQEIKNELLLEVAKKYNEFYADINKQLSDLNIDNYNLKINEFKGLELISANIEQYKQEEQKLKDEIDKLTGQQEFAENELELAKKREEDIRELKNRYDLLNERKANLEDNFTLPDVQTKYRTEYVYEDVRGVWGFLKWCLNGKDKSEKIIEVIDSTRRDEAQLLYDKKMENLCSELSNINTQIGKHKESKNSVKIKNDLKKLERRIEDFEEQQRKNREEFRENLKKVSEANIKRIRQNIKYYVEDQSDVTLKAIEQTLDINVNRWIQAINSVVNDSIDGEAKRLQSELDNIIEIMNSQGKEREKILANNAKSMDDLKILLSKTLDLESEINKIMSDKLELDDSSEQSDLIEN